jgi:hypothetical protein
MDTAVNNTHPTTSGLVTAHPKEEALWLLETLVPGSVPNNLSLAFLVDGLLEESLLQQALTAAV